MTATHLPQIQPPDKSALSELQQQFNHHVAKIDQLKADMAMHLQQLDQARARVQKEIQPLVQEMVQKRMDYVLVLDQMHQNNFFRKPEQEKIAYLVREISFSLYQEFGREDMKAYFDRYTTPPPAAEKETLAAQNAKEQTQQMLQNMLGLDVNLADLEDFGSLQEKLEEQMRQEQEKREAQQRNRQKSKTQQAKAQIAKVELQNIGKATRRLYTDLAKLLHPDRELDPTVRLWKEEAMKKVTIAYHQDDFFELLRLQMEFMHEQELRLTQVPETQLQYYVQLLSEQIKELETQQSDFYLGPEGRFYQHYGGTPKQMETKFRKTKKEIRQEIKYLQQDLALFQQDPAYLREYLKDIKL